MKRNQRNSKNSRAPKGSKRKERSNYKKITSKRLIINIAKSSKQKTIYLFETEDVKGSVLYKVLKVRCPLGEQLVEYIEKKEIYIGNESPVSLSDNFKSSRALKGLKIINADIKKIRNSTGYICIFSSNKENQKASMYAWVQSIIELKEKYTAIKYIRTKEISIISASSNGWRYVVELVDLESAISIAKTELPSHWFPKFYALRQSEAS